MWNLKYVMNIIRILCTKLQLMSLTKQRYIDEKDPIGSKLLFLSHIRSRKGAYLLKTIILRDSDIKR